MGYLRTSHAMMQASTQAALTGHLAACRVYRRHHDAPEPSRLFHCWTVSYGRVHDAMMEKEDVAD